MTEPTVNTPSAAYEAQKKEWELIDLILSGVEKVRESCGDGSSSTGILRRERGEKPAEFNRRRDQSELVNFLAEMIEDHAGMLFRRHPTFDDEVPEEFKGSAVVKLPMQEEEEVSRAAAAMDGLLAQVGGSLALQIKALWMLMLGFVARLFGKGKKVGGEPGWAENIDLQGNHLQIFGKKLYRSAKRHGMACIYIDMPPKPDNERTEEDQKRNGRRPYWIMVTAPDLIEATPRTVNGVTRLAQARWRERATVKKSRFDPGKPVNRVRVLVDGLADSEATPANPGLPTDHPRAMGLTDEERLGMVFSPDDPARLVSWELWEEVEDEKTKQKAWIPVDGGVRLSPRFIPLIPLQLDPEAGFFEANPPAETKALAYTTREYFRKKSGADHHLRVANVSVVHWGGGPPKEPQEVEGAQHVNPGRLNEESFFVSADPSGHMEFVEPSGAVDTANREHLKELRDRASQQARQPLMPGTGDITATDSALRNAKANSVLEAQMVAYVDCIEQAMDVTMQVARVSAKPGEGGSLVVDLEKMQLASIGTQFSDVLELRKNRVIGDKTTIKEAVRYRVLGEDTDVEEVMKEVEEDLPGGLAGEDPTSEIAALKERMAMMEAAPGVKREPQQMAQEGGPGSPGAQQAA